jgi:hypothetical protein
MRRSGCSVVVFFALLAACGQTGGGCGNGCAPLTPLPSGVFLGEKLDSVAAGRLTAGGFGVINANPNTLLEQIAPGGSMVVSIPCTIQNALLENLTIADEGELYCTSETCGQLDGKCDARDVPKPVTVKISSLVLAPQGPDLVEAAMDVTITTGKIMVSSVSRSSLLCLFSDPVKCSLDFDSTRAAPLDNFLKVHARFTVDPRWDKVLTFEIPDIGGSKACGAAGALPKPECFDPADTIIAKEGACNVCTAANFTVIKTLVIDQITKALKARIEHVLLKADARPCGPEGLCPMNGVADSVCRPRDGGTSDGGILDAGDCVDPVTDKFVPNLLGVEGRMSLGLAPGVPAGAGLDLSLGAGGSSVANDAGITVGFRGGAKEIAVADCVKPITHAPEPVLPLPDLDADAPGPYDVGLALSQQLLSRAFFHAQQSGALCLELGHEQVVQLDSSLIGALLPSLNKLVGKDLSVPLRVVIRPTNPPSATLGAGTLNPMTMKPLEPLIRFDWDAVEIDLYAKLEERYVRLFTVAADVKLPLGLSLSNCSDVTPVVGDLTGAVTNVHASNSEILPENLKVIEMLVPSLLSLAEPQLARALKAFTVPVFGGWKLKLLAAQGVGPISGTKTFNHVGLYAKLLTANQVCLANAPRLHPLTVVRHEGSQVELKVEPGSPSTREYQTRVNGGLWSHWQPASADGVLTVNHPRLLLKTEHQIEVQVRERANPEGVSEPVAVRVVP